MPSILHIEVSVVVIRSIDVFKDILHWLRLHGNGNPTSFNVTSGVRAADESDVAAKFQVMLEM
jgi:hypothetical protein